MTDRSDGKLDAVITQVVPDKGYALALDDHGVSYFCYVTHFAVLGAYEFRDLVRGSRVRLRPISGPKGPRGLEIEIVAL